MCAASITVSLGQLGILFGFLAVVAGQQPPSAPAAKQASHQLVYEGEPLVIPLQCRSEHLLRAGTVCNEDSPCELFVELIDLATAGEKIFVVGDIHTTAATVSSIMLVSDDEGKSWSEPAERIGGAGFELIQFIDADHGWVAGHEWELDTSARPFLLATHDGGVRWQQRYVWDSNDDRSGSILEFRFETAQHGFLVIDRLSSEGDPYEFYESMNGGRSWNIRQTSREKLTVPRTLSDASHPDWRLQENRKQGVYEVQRNQAGSWVVISQFSSPVGSCEAMEPEKQDQEEAAPE